MKAKKVDWDAVEREYRVGQLSLRALASKHDCTAAAISKKAKEKRWAKDATQEVRERTRAALIVHAADNEESVNTVNSSVNTPTREDVAVAVQTNLAVIKRHRKDIGQGQEIVSLLMGQLIDTAVNRESIENDIEIETKDDDNGQRRYRMNKAISLPSNAAVLRDLSTAMKNLVALERQAYNLDEVSGEESIEDRLARLMEAKA
jgi:hypothetical protein